MSINLVDISILAVASGRIAYSLAYEEIFSPIRSRIALKNLKHPMILELISCPYCLSFWTSLGLFGLYMLLGAAVIPFIIPFALWGAASLIARTL